MDEPNANGNLGAINASLPTQPTHYEYDGNDNLSKVIQSDGTTTQERRFKYDSLSRLVAEKQVEANATLDINGGYGAIDPVNKWTKVLKYNATGPLTDGFDARGARTQFTYDGLNRVKTVTYSGETGYKTPGVTYTYDRFGNRTSVAATGTAADNSTISTDGIPTLAFASASNRITTSGFQYDVAANQTKALNEKQPAAIVQRFDCRMLKTSNPS